MVITLEGFVHIRAAGLVLSEGKARDMHVLRTHTKDEKALNEGGKNLAAVLGSKI